MPSITVNIPEPKRDDALEKKLDKAYDRLVRLEGRPMPHMDMSKMLSVQQQMVKAIGKLQTAVEKGLSLDSLEQSLDDQWAQMRKLLKARPEVKTTVAMPQAFYARMDALQEALNRPASTRMSPAIGQKLDSIREAITASRPKVRGMMR